MLRAQWLQGRRQRMLFAQQQVVLQSSTAEHFGYYCLIESIDPANSFAQVCRQQCTMQLMPSWSPTDSSELAFYPLYADPHYLPFANDSIDMVVIHHMLEACEDPHHIIRQAARVVMPEGKLVVFGSHPVSFIGMGQVAQGMYRPSWRYHMPSAGRVRDWLQLLSFTDFAISYQNAKEPKPKLTSLRSGHTYGHLGARMASPFAASWAIVATKHRYAKIMPSSLRTTKLASIQGQVARRCQG